MATHPFQCTAPLAPVAPPATSPSVSYPQELARIETARTLHPSASLDLYEAMVRLNDPETFLPAIPSLIDRARASVPQTGMLSDQVQLAEARFYLRLASQSRDEVSAQGHVRKGIAAIRPLLDRVQKTSSDMQAQIWVDALTTRQALAQLELIREMSEADDAWSAARETEVCAARTLIASIPNAGNRLDTLTRVHARTLLLQRHYAEALRLDPSLKPPHHDDGFLGRLKSGAMEAVAQSDRFGTWPSLVASTAGCAIGAKIAGTAGAAAGAGAGSVVPGPGTAAGAGGGGIIGGVSGCVGGAIGGFLLIRGAAAVTSNQVWEAAQTGFTLEDWQSTAWNSGEFAVSGALSAWAGGTFTQAGRKILATAAQDLPLLAKSLATLPAKLAQMSWRDVAASFTTLPKVKVAPASPAAPWLEISWNWSAARVAKVLGFGAMYGLIGASSVKKAQANPGVAPAVDASLLDDPITEVAALALMVLANHSLARLYNVPKHLAAGKSVLEALKLFPKNHTLLQTLGLGYYGLWRWADHRGGHEPQPLEAMAGVAMGMGIIGFMTQNPFSEAFRINPAGTVFGTLVATYPWLTNAVSAGQVSGWDLFRPLTLSNAFTFAHVSASRLDLKFTEPLFARIPFLRAFAGPAQGPHRTGLGYDTLRKYGFPIHEMNVLPYLRFFYLANFPLITGSLEALGQGIGASMSYQPPVGEEEFMGPWRRRTYEQMVYWSPIRTYFMMKLDFSTIGARLAASLWFGFEDTVLNRRYKPFSGQQRWTTDFQHLLAQTPSWPEWSGYFKTAMMNSTYLNGDELDVDFDDLDIALCHGKFALKPEHERMLAIKLRDFEAMSPEDQRLALFLLAVHMRATAARNQTMDLSLEPYRNKLSVIDIPDEDTLRRASITTIRRRINQWQ